MPPPQVFCTEPLPSDSPLWRSPNLLLSPHNAGYTETFLHESVAFFITNLNRYLEGVPLYNLVDKDSGY